MRLATLSLSGTPALCARRGDAYYPLSTAAGLPNDLAGFLAAGATGCSAIVTHCVLPGDSLAMLERSGLLDRIVVTDSHPRAALLRSAFLQVDSVAGIFAGYLREAFP